MKTFRSLAILALGVALDAEATSAPTSAPSAGPRFCGFPLDIHPDPFAEPLEICNELVTTESGCEASLFFSSYECYWDNGKCTSNADLTGEDETCPPIGNQTACEAEEPWIGPRNCVWWEPTESPSLSPSDVPSLMPSVSPSSVPSPEPTREPTPGPTLAPSSTPSSEPSVQPSRKPSRAPSSEPSRQPSFSPSMSPTLEPSVHPSRAPTLEPSSQPTDEPSQSPSTSQPSSSPSSAPSNEGTASPTFSPSLFPTGIPSAEPSQGPSPVMTEEPSAPSRAPSDQPSLTPTVSLAPSLSPTKLKIGDETEQPTVSLAPSSTPSIVPTASPVNTFPPVFHDPDKFSWNIERLGPAAVAFNDESDQEEIMIDYNISLRENTVVVYEDDCKTVVPSSVIEVHKTLTPNSTSHGTLAVDLDIMQAAITSSPVWTDGSAGIGYIDICIRVDLMLVEENPPISVNFHETVLALTIDLTQNFQMTIDIDRTNADDLAQETAVNYTVYACQCDTEEVCIEKTIVPGDEVLFCMWTTSIDIEFVSIMNMDFTQDTLKWHPVLDGVEDDLTAVTLEGDKCVVRSQMASVFFAEDNPLDVLVEGLALLAFADTNSSSADGGRRFLQASIVPRRIDETGRERTGAFSLSVGLGSADRSSAPSEGLVPFVVILVSSVFLLSF